MTRAMLRKTIKNLDKMLQQHQDQVVKKYVVAYKDGVVVSRGATTGEISKRLGLSLSRINNQIVGNIDHVRGYTFERFYFVDENDV